MKQISTSHSVRNLSFRLAPMFPLIGMGTAAAVAAGSALIFVFGSFSDISAVQLAAGPSSAAKLPNGQPVVTARTGRSWAASSATRSATAQAEPLAKLARAEARAGGK